MISIITPSFRQLDWLGLAMASVADQEGVEVEHIIQDGETKGIRERLTESHAGKRLRLFIEKDLGMYDAINRGLQRAKGDLCAYLNCDEQYLPGALAKVQSFFDAHPNTQLLFGDVILVNEQGEPVSYRRSIRPTKNHIRVAHLNTASCAMFFRRELIDRNFLFDPRWKAIGDAVWVHTLLEHKIKMAILPVPLAVFTFTGQNLGATSTSIKELQQFHMQSPALNLGRRLPVAFHRIRKLFAGAYRRRRITIRIYTLGSPTLRQAITRENVGYGWPDNSTPQPRGRTTDS